MRKIIVESNQFEDLCAKVSCIRAQTAGIISLLEHGREVYDAIDMCYILLDHSENVTNKLYDLLEKAEDVKEDGGGNDLCTGMQKKCTVFACENEHIVLNI